VANPTSVIQPVACSPSTNIPSKKGSIDDVNVDALSGIMQHWKCSPCLPVKSGSIRSSLPGAYALKNSESLDRVKALCLYPGFAVEMWNAFFTKPIDEKVHIGTVVSKNNIRKDLCQMVKFPTDVLTAPMLPTKLKDKSSSPAPLPHQYQRKVPAFLQANAVSLPCTYAEVGPKYYLRAPPRFANELQARASTRGPPTIADLVRSQYGLPKTGDHTKWKPSSEHKLLQKT
jgi:hypothetical protein